MIPVLKIEALRRQGLLLGWPEHPRYGRLATQEEAGSWGPASDYGDFL